MKQILSILFLAASFSVSAQLAPDFMITDSDGVEHSLYADHLDQGQTVVIKLFFTTCPPCIALAPFMEARYQEWGAGQYDVEFIELSTQGFDYNVDVAEYKNEHNVTFPGVGRDGGSLDAAAPFQSGQFGVYYGTPTVIVISPDGTVQMDFDYLDLNDVIAGTGATGMGSGGGGSADVPTTININASIIASVQPSSLSYILKPANADTPRYNIGAITGGALNFEYPSADFPELVDPVIVLEAEGDVIDNNVNALDLLKMRKHILDLEPFTEDSQLLGADVNSDDKINALDLLNMQRALLGLISQFPNGTPSWKVTPTQIPLQAVAGSTENVSFQVIKTGNVN